MNANSYENAIRTQPHEATVPVGDTVTVITFPVFSGSAGEEAGTESDKGEAMERVDASSALLARPLLNRLHRMHRIRAGGDADCHDGISAGGTTLVRWICSWRGIWARRGIGRSARRCPVPASDPCRCIGCIPAPRPVGPNHYPTCRHDAEYNCRN